MEGASSQRVKICIELYMMSHSHSPLSQCLFPLHYYILFKNIVLLDMFLIALMET